MTIRRRLRSWWCVLVNGQHEYFIHHDGTHLYQECLLCKHQSHGWYLSPPKGKP